MYIYKLEFNNSLNYVGLTTTGLEGRVQAHMSQMVRNKHYNNKVQNAYNTYGIPKVIILESEQDGLTIENISEREIFWIAKLDSFHNGLNNSLGGECSPRGEDSVHAQHYLDDYMAVVVCLANTDWTFKEVAEELGINYGIVQSINYGSAHQYLAELLPIEYEKMRSKHGFRNLKAGGFPDLISEYGEVVKITNISEFARQHGLQQPNISAVLRGVKRIHKGWTLADPSLRKKLQAISKGETYKVVSPDGVIETIYDIDSFILNNNLNKTAFKRMLNGDFSHHKGWKLYE